MDFFKWFLLTLFLNSGNIDKEKQKRICNILYSILRVFFTLFILLILLAVAIDEEIRNPMAIIIIFSLLSLMWIKPIIRKIKAINKVDDNLYQQIIFILYKEKNITEEILKRYGIDIEQKTFMSLMKQAQKDGILSINKKDNIIVVKEEALQEAVEHNYYYLSEKDREEKRQEKQYYIDTVSKHAKVLVRKYKQLVYCDDYGIKKYGKFKGELEYFIRNVLYKKRWDCNVIEETEKLLDYIETNLLPADNSIVVTDNPFDFEKQCADILNENGWQATATQKSSDQGIDVVATKNGKTVAIQCKLYSKPVGNKAVQEAFSGKEFYSAEYAAVVSNNTYTPSAKQLAANCGVLLLSVDDLPQLDTLL